MSNDIRVLSSDADLRKAVSIFYTALVAFPAPDGDLSGRFEPGRCLGAFDDGELAGTATSFGSWLVVPGGARVQHCAVTDVGVLPSHKRRGLAGALIRRQFADAAAQGEIIATLRASEAVIYERFGYGVANQAAAVQVSTRRGGGLRSTVPEGGPVRLVDVESSWDLLRDIYAAATRPGSIERHAYWWNGYRAYLAETKQLTYIAVHGRPGHEDGFAIYSPSDPSHWFSGKDRAIAVSDFVAHTQEAYLGLLRFLLGIDLIDRVDLQTMPTDHGLSLLLNDPRAAGTVEVRDETWLRLIDVPAALAARTYSGPASVTIEVTDAILPQNDGTYRVSVDGVERIAESASAAADLALDVATLGAVYLGGTSWWQLARAGRVTERTDGALAIAEQLFTAPSAPFQAPFSGTMF